MNDKTELELIADCFELLNSRIYLFQKKLDTLAASQVSTAKKLKEFERKLELFTERKMTIRK